MRAFTSTRTLWQDEAKKEELKKEEEAKEETKDEAALEEEAPVKDMKDEKIEELEKLVRELRNNWKLALADAENIKKIAARDVEKARDFGIEKLVKQLMGVVDTLDIVVQNKPDFELEENKNNELAKSAFLAIDAIYKQFFQVFGNYGLVEVRPKIGDSFDPMLHNALFEVDAPPGSDAKPGTIGLFVKSGWKRKDILIRPANVGVVKSPDH